MSAAGVDRHLTAAEIKSQAQRWYERQIERASAAHGVRWSTHRPWVDAYVREELRLRLVARGWVVRHA
jgi:hypothetical protein